jgi:hypothetical protein
MKPILMGAIGVEWMGWGVVVEEGMSRVGGWEDGEWLCDGVVGAVRGWVN